MEGHGPGGGAAAGLGVPACAASPGLGHRDQGPPRAGAVTTRQRSEVGTIATKTRNMGNVSRDALLSLVEQSLEDDLAEDVRIISLAGKSDIADYMVIASGRSARKVGAIAAGYSTPRLALLVCLSRVPSSFGDTSATLLLRYRYTVRRT